MSTNLPQEIPGRVTFMEGNGELPKIQIATPWSHAEIYLQGAHITHFQNIGEPPLLFLSHVSRFEKGTPIRGGIPIIFPWFGPREGQVMHGFARNQTWDLKEIIQSPGGGLHLKFNLPDCDQAALLPKFTADYSVEVNQSLRAELTIQNMTEDENFIFENCLHTYFTVGDVSAISISGLKGTDYLDKCKNFARWTETTDSIKIAEEIDRVYLDTTSTVEIHDTNLKRRIIVEKSGSVSTVLWNPWIAKSQQMPDFGNDEYQRMICVESGNVAGNQITLPPGKSCSLQINLRAAPL